jgi:hypothetical protein
MAFGTGTAGVISRSTTNTAQAAEKTDKDGKVTEITTYGASKEVVEETFADSATNTATSGQSGSSDIIISDNYTESNTEYARLQVTKRSVNI